MTPTELADLGFGLAGELAREAERIYFKDDRHYHGHEFADNIRVKAEDVLKLSSDAVVMEKLRGSALLSRARQLPDLATLAERVEQFEQLYEAFVNFTRAGVSWEVHFAANGQKFVDMWGKAERWERAFHERKRRFAEEGRRRFAEDLAFARDKFSAPAQVAPCFAEARKNGLSCARSDLVEIVKLPAVVSAGTRIEISIKRCSRCWQLYKECFEVDELTKQFRSRFLKPDETDAERGFHFSPAEAEEYGQIDFRALVNPNLKAAKEPRWQTKNGTFLIQRNMAPVRDISGGVGLKNGERFDESAEYYEITNTGSVTRKYGAPRSFSLEGELFVSGIHLVIGDALYDFCWSRRYPEEAGLEVKMLLYDLQPCDGPLPFDAETAIRDYEQASNRPLPSTNDDSNPAGSRPGQAAAAESVTVAPGDSHIPVGIPHRALCDIEMLVYDYDAMGVKTEVLPAGGIFQPWEPLDHWRGIQIPITLGDRAAEFDWGVTAYEGHFLAWDDFFSRCRMSAPESDVSAS